MKIENFTEKLETERFTKEAIFSEPHIINFYKMRLKVFTDGYDTGQGTHISIFFQLMKGAFDDSLTWPFPKSVTLIVMHPDADLDYEHTLKKPLWDDDDIEYFQKPLDENVPYGLQRFITHTELYSEGYIKKDTLYIKCEVR